MSAPGVLLFSGPRTARALTQPKCKLSYTCDIHHCILRVIVSLCFGIFCLWERGHVTAEGQHSRGLSGSKRSAYCESLSSCVPQNHRTADQKFDRSLQTEVKKWYTTTERKHIRSFGRSVLTSGSGTTENISILERENRRSSSASDLPSFGTQRSATFSVAAVKYPTSATVTPTPNKLATNETETTSVDTGAAKDYQRLAYEKKLRVARWEPGVRHNISAEAGPSAGSATAGSELWSRSTVERSTSSYKVSSAESPQVDVEAVFPVRDTSDLIWTAKGGAITAARQRVDSRITTLPSANKPATENEQKSLEDKSTLSSQLLKYVPGTYVKNTANLVNGRGTSPGNNITSPSPVSPYAGIPADIQAPDAENPSRPCRKSQAVCGTRAYFRKLKFKSMPETTALTEEGDGFFAEPPPPQCGFTSAKSTLKRRFTPLFAANTFSPVSEYAATSQEVRGEQLDFNIDAQRHIGRVSADRDTSTRKAGSSARELAELLHGLTDVIESPFSLSTTKNPSDTQRVRAPIQESTAGNYAGLFGKEVATDASAPEYEVPFHAGPTARYGGSGTGRSADKLEESSSRLYTPVPRHDTERKSTVMDNLPTTNNTPTSAPAPPSRHREKGLERQGAPDRRNLKWESRLSVSDWKRSGISTGQTPTMQKPYLEGEAEILQPSEIHVNVGEHDSSSAHEYQVPDQAHTSDRSQGVELSDGSADGLVEAPVESMRGKLTAAVNKPYLMGSQAKMQHTKGPKDVTGEPDTLELGKSAQMESSKSNVLDPVHNDVLQPTLAGTVAEEARKSTAEQIIRAVEENGAKDTTENSTTAQIPAETSARGLDQTSGDSAQARGDASEYGGERVALGQFPGPPENAEDFAVGGLQQAECNPENDTANSSATLKVETKATKPVEDDKNHGALVDLLKSSTTGKFTEETGGSFAQGAVQTAQGDHLLKALQPAAVEQTTTDTSQHNFSSASVATASGAAGGLGHLAPFALEDLKKRYLGTRPEPPDVIPLLCERDQEKGACEGGISSSVCPEIFGQCPTGYCPSEWLQRIRQNTSKRRRFSRYVRQRFGLSDSAIFEQVKRRGLCPSAAQGHSPINKFGYPAYDGRRGRILLQKRAPLSIVHGKKVPIKVGPEDYVIHGTFDQISAFLDCFSDYEVYGAKLLPNGKWTYDPKEGPVYLQIENSQRNFRFPTSVRHLRVRLLLEWPLLAMSSAGPLSTAGLLRGYKEVAALAKNVDKMWNLLPGFSRAELFEFWNDVVNTPTLKGRRALICHFFKSAFSRLKLEREKGWIDTKNVDLKRPLTLFLTSYPRQSHGVRATLAMNSNRVSLADIRNKFPGIYRPSPDVYTVLQGAALPS